MPINKIANTLLELGLIIGLAYLMAQTIWLVAYGPTAVASEHDPPVITATVRDNTALTAAQIEGWALFGDQQTLFAGGSTSTVIGVPETDLALTLLGVFHQRGSNDGWAIISNDQDETQLVHPGEKLGDNIILETIFMDRVMLNRGGRRETLRLADKDSEPGIDRVANFQTGENLRDKDVKEMLSQRQLILHKAGLQPLSDTSPEGYRVGKDAKDLQKKYGLKEGDVIVSANGYPLGTEADDVLAYTLFRDIGFASIVIRRGSEDVVMEYEK